MPADGKISECGHIGRADEGVLHEDAGHIFQAKGHGFTTAQLLADEEAASAFDGGVYATVYLSPKDYHRVHMPWTGTLRETVHVPGRLFSVGTGCGGLGVAAVRTQRARWSATSTATSGRWPW